MTPAPTPPVALRRANGRLWIETGPIYAREAR